MGIIEKAQNHNPTGRNAKYTADTLRLAIAYFNSELNTSQVASVLYPDKSTYGTATRVRMGAILRAAIADGKVKVVEE